MLSQNYPCSVKEVPKTISDAVHSKSSFITCRVDNKTRGRFCNHELEILLATNATLIYLWKRSIKPLVQG